MKTILCPTDFSTCSANAIKYAVALNEWLHCKIILLHVESTPVFYADAGIGMIPYDNSFSKELTRTKFQSFVKRTIATSANRNLKAELMIKQGLPSDIILQTALETKADLLIMGETGNNAAERLIIGSNTLRLIKNAPCTLLVIPDKFKFKKPEKIVYTTDLTEENLSHVNTLIPLAKIFKSELLFLHIDNTFTGKDGPDLHTVSKTIRKYVPYTKKSGYVCTDVTVSAGINYFMKHHKAGYLAMYTRHRTMLKEIFKPSTTKKVALHAKVPLIVIHENDYVSLSVNTPSLELSENN